MGKIKIRKEENGHSVFIDEKDISKNVRKINISIDAEHPIGSYAIVDIQMIAEVDVQIESTDS